MANRVPASAPTSVGDPPAEGPVASGAARAAPARVNLDLVHRSRDAFRLVGTALAGIDGRGRIVTANPAFEALLGLEAAEILDHPLADLWDVSLFGREGDDQARLQAGGAMYLRVQPVAAGVPPCSMRVVRLTDREGSRICFGIQVERVDERDRRIEFGAVDNGLRVSLDQLVIGLSTVEMDGRMSSVNQAYCELVGRGPDELAGLDVFTLVHPDDRREDLDRALLVLAGEHQGWTREKRLLRPDGSVAWVLETVKLGRGDDGESMHFLCQTIDISDRKAAEERLRESEARIEMRAEGLPLGLMRTDRRGVIEEANSALTDLLGLDPVGLHWTALMVAGDVDRVAMNFTDAVAPDHDWQIEFRIPGPHGAPRWIRANGRPQADAAGALAATMSIWTDVTDLKAVEDHLREQATTDSLTGLPNRAIFYDRLQHALALAGRSQTRVGVLFVDLDKFKPVNDAWGHAAGDLLLQLVGRRLSEAVRAADTLARVGGDEFMVLAESIVAVDTVRAIGERIIARMAEPFDLPYGQARIGASVGLAVSDVRSTPQTLVRAADVAVYRAKAAGGGRIVVT